MENVSTLINWMALANTQRVLAFTNGEVIFNGGNLSGPFTNQIVLTNNNKILNLSSNKLTLTIPKSSGLFNGNVVVPGTGKAEPFKGAVFQKQNSGSGYFLSANQSGKVSVGPN